MVVRNTTAVRPHGTRLRTLRLSGHVARGSEHYGCPATWHEAQNTTAVRPHGTRLRTLRLSGHMARGSEHYACPVTWHEAQNTTAVRPPGTRLRTLRLSGHMARGSEPLRLSGQKAYGSARSYKCLGFKRTVRSDHLTGQKLSMSVRVWYK